MKQPEQRFVKYDVLLSITDFLVLSVISLFPRFGAGCQLYKMKSHRQQ